MPQPFYSVLHPTARPSAWRAAYDTWISRANNPDYIEYLLCVDERWGFELHNKALAAWMLERPSRNFVVWNSGRKCMVDAVNDAARPSHGRVLIVSSDDMEAPADWDYRLAVQMGSHVPTEEDFVLHVSTGYCDGPQASGIQILSRARYEKLGYVFYPGYESLFADDDFLQHAYHDGVVIDARHLLFPHNHAPAGEWDEVYQYQNSGEARRLGEALLRQRAMIGFSEMPAFEYRGCNV